MEPADQNRCLEPADQNRCLEPADQNRCLAIPGCTDASACNYFEVANLDDGSCDYCSCINAPVIDGYSVNLETVAVDGVPGMTTYRLYVTMVNPTDVLSSIVGEDGMETYINTTASFYQDPFGGALGQATNPLLFSIAPQLPYDSYVTIGLTEIANTAAGEVEVTAVESENANWIAPFEAGGNIAIDGAFGGAWFTLNGATNAMAGDDLQVLLGQFTTSGTLSGQISLQIFPEGDGENDVIITFPIGNTSDHALVKDPNGAPRAPLETEELLCGKQAGNWILVPRLNYERIRRVLKKMGTPSGRSRLHQSQCVQSQYICQGHMGLLDLGEVWPTPWTNLSVAERPRASRKPAQGRPSAARWATQDYVYKSFFDQRR